MSAFSNSALYEGHVVHRRHTPVAHAFRFPLAMCYLDLDELDELFRRRWLWSAHRPNLAWFRRQDYLDPEVDCLSDAVRLRVERETGRRSIGPIRTLTHLRTWGHCFNPITVYYCFDANDDSLEAVVAEITNTPWGDRHAYVLPSQGPADPYDWHQFRFRKRFHVSPFMPMELDYDWRFRLPGEALGVHMNVLREGVPVFDATLSLARREMTGPAMARVLVRYPAMTLQVTAAIYWQAMRLWLKRAPFHPHPSKRQERPRELNR